MRLVTKTCNEATLIPTGIALADAPEPPPPAKDIVGADVYPLPRLVYLIAIASEFVEIVAVALARVIAAFGEKVIFGGDV